MSLSHYALLMLAGSDEAAVGFVENLPGEVRVDFAAKATRLHDLAYMTLLADPVKFLAFKVPDPLPDIGLSMFRSVFDPLLEHGLAEVPWDEIHSKLTKMTLAECYVFFSAASRLYSATQKKPLLAGAPIEKKTDPVLPQNELF